MGQNKTPKRKIIS